MKVTMIPVNAEDVINRLYVACRTCYHAGKPEDMYKEILVADYELQEFKFLEQEKRVKLIKYVLDSGHHSVLEHQSLTFLISGVSRALTHQLVRHRLCSYSQQSQRYCDVEDGKFEYVTPHSIENDDEALKIFEKTMSDLAVAYDTLRKLDIPSEDARSVLPNACCSNITMSVNLRELIHICNERLCTCAQDEIRGLFKQIAKEVSNSLPFMKSYLVPKCEALGYCNEEKRGCGRKPKKSSIAFVKSEGGK